MGFVERSEEAQAEVKDLSPLQRAVAKTIGERPSVEVLHDEVGKPVRFPDPVDGNDRQVIQARKGSRLTEKTFGRDGGGPLRTENFDGDRSVEAPLAR